MCMEHHLVGCPDKSVYAYSIFSGVSAVLSKAKLGGLGAKIHNKVLVSVKVKRKVKVHSSLKPGQIVVWLSKNIMVFNHRYTTQTLAHIISTVIIYKPEWCTST